MPEPLTNSQAGKSNRIPPSTTGWLIASVVMIFLLAVLAHELTMYGRKFLGRELIEYPIWAVSLGLIINYILKGLKVRETLQAGFRTELFLKTGLVLLGATININDILQFGVRGLAQAVILITLVFSFTWYISTKLGLEDKLKALIATAISICGVSAAIAAAGAVIAKKEHLGYVTTLVIAFALPLMLLQPFLATQMGLSPDVAGAWMGGNIDTTAAVVGAGAIYGEQAMKVASIVKMAQNSLIGIAAFLLALYWVLKMDNKGEKKPRAIEIWRRFPKFVLGFIAASIVTTILFKLGWIELAQIKVLTGLRNWFLTMAFISIGLEVSLRGMFGMGIKPVVVYALATTFNTLLALLVALLLFS